MPPPLTTSSAEPAPAQRAPRASSDALSALKDAGAVGRGVFPLGVAFGVLVVHSGLAWWWATVFSGLIYAGSLEFLLLGMVTIAAPLTQIALTALMVNLRHVFYALSFPLHRVKSRAGKTYSTFAMVDEAYALTAGEAAASWSERRILWLQAFIHASWVSGATTGALVGGLIPARIDRLEFARPARSPWRALRALRAHRPI